jgi:hypothetical protein
MNYCGSAPTVEAVAEMTQAAHYVKSDTLIIVPDLRVVILLAFVYQQTVKSQIKAPDISVGRDHPRYMPSQRTITAYLHGILGFKHLRLRADWPSLYRRTPKRVVRVETGVSRKFTFQGFQGERIPWLQRVKLNDESTFPGSGSEFGFTWYLALCSLRFPQHSFRWSS